MIHNFLFSVFIFSSFNMFAPEPLDRWLVELHSSDDTCLEEWWEVHGAEVSGVIKKKLPVGHWWVLQVPASRSASLKNLSCVSYIGVDHRIEWRDKVPNDPAYISQGDMNLIGMPGAWGISTGGVTSAGDTIVVAVIDDGFQSDHPDLVKNIWVNRLEIAQDGIDNDMNGYVDDRIGYNVTTGDDTHPVKTHGTSVCGIIGAVGNNNLGVSGVNWAVKLMLISGADFESDVIEAYQYVIDMRERYRQTDGAKGAFVVATNLSGGINNAWADDHPLWCEMYDKLGAKGILSVTAAPNNSISVDVDGDMPTTCTSPYMMAVTNVDPSDVIVGNAGYGVTSIDIGAPGHGTFTTASGNQYKEFPGTSAAAPHVAGAIALMYSTPCEEFLSGLETNPSQVAGRVRDLIFSTATDNNSLMEITSTGKRLQVNKALLATTTTDCGAPIEPGIQIVSIQPNPARGERVKVFFQVEGEVSGAFFEVFAANGVKVTEVPVEDGTTEGGLFEIDSKHLPAGVYLITLRYGGEKSTHKLVVIN